MIGTQPADFAAYDGGFVAQDQPVAGGGIELHVFAKMMAIAGGGFRPRKLVRESRGFAIIGQGEREFGVFQRGNQRNSLHGRINGQAKYLQQSGGQIKSPGELADEARGKRLAWNVEDDWNRRVVDGVG